MRSNKLAERSEIDLPFVIEGEFKFEVQRCNPKGCEKVAGGRSEAKTTGEAGMTAPRRGARRLGYARDFFAILAPLWCNSFLTGSGGFRFASTTAYYLPALRADVSLKFCCQTRLYHHELPRSVLYKNCE